MEGNIYDLNEVPDGQRVKTLKATTVMSISKGGIPTSEESTLPIDTYTVGTLDFMGKTLMKAASAYLVMEETKVEWNPNQNLE
ncbi:MAG TPA: hypothetical protein PKU78_06440 [Candidatus Dojkabacteria bacterium]|nr:hypothetical protein [Candidatus Dojkabacteria bacterium]HRO65836.1 hypothetical protein [Candidatus Dojkabacteria bacterium]HRP50750.1 hypothetical protein [Candidatus Dojkabacteria bacterium]